MRKLLAILLCLSNAACGQAVISGGATVGGGVIAGHTGNLFFDATFEDGTLNGLTATCRQNNVPSPTNQPCNETTNKSAVNVTTAAYTGTHSAYMEGNSDTSVDYHWRNSLNWTASSPKNPAVTSGNFWYGFSLRMNADNVTCFGQSGGANDNQQKESLSRPESGGGGWSMLIWGRLKGASPNNDDQQAEGDGFGQALTPGGSGNLFDLEPNTWYRFKWHLSRDTALSRGTVSLYYDSGSGWTRANWTTGSDDITETPDNNQHTNSNHGWDSETIAQKVEVGMAVMAPEASACTGLTTAMWVDDVWAADYDYKP